MGVHSPQNQTCVAQSKQDPPTHTMGPPCIFLDKLLKLLLQLYLQQRRKVFSKTTIQLHKEFYKNINPLTCFHESYFISYEKYSLNALNAFGPVEPPVSEETL